MVELKPGQLVRSLAGRDRGQHYLVLKEIDRTYVLLVNGRSKPVDRPKKKNKVHLQRYERSADLGGCPEAGGLTDNQVTRHINELIPAAGFSEEEV